MCFAEGSTKKIVHKKKTARKMQSKTLKLLVTTAILFNTYCNGTTISLEAEAGSYTGATVTRSAASNQRTVRLRQGQFIVNTFTSSGNCSIRFTNIVYTNDGDSDTIAASLDGRVVGTFSTLARTGGGNLWNVPRNSGRIGDAIELGSGLHQTRIEAITTDRYDVEIDRVILTADCNVSSSMCYSLNSLPHVAQSCSDNNMTGIAQQKSTQTACAEEDNIHIPLYYSNIHEYTIVATLPQYAASTVSNNRDPDFTNCEQTSRLIWVIGTPDQSGNEFNSSCISQQNFTIGDPPLTLCRQISSNDIQQQTIVFSARGRSSGLVDATIGSLFTVTFTTVTGILLIEARYYGREQRWISLGIATFSSGQLTHTWHIPDLTWAEGLNNNFIQLLTSAGSTANARAFYDYLQLERRQERGETVTRIFNGYYTVIEVVEIDFWWLYPDAMTIYITDTGRQWSNVSYFRISQRIPGTSYYPQVFVLYQDGNSRILTFPPTSLQSSWIPFGSSVIIGPSDPNAVRPYAAISRVDINVAELKMTLHYQDGGQATIMLMTNRSSTVLKVTNITYAANASLPFATLRSMWVTDGNSDADRIATENGVWNIQHGWNEVSGTNILFFRECVSQHNTLSPDIRVVINCTIVKSSPVTTPTLTPTHITATTVSHSTPTDTSIGVSAVSNATPTHAPVNVSSFSSSAPNSMITSPSTTMVGSKASTSLLSLEWLVVSALLILHTISD